MYILTVRTDKPEAEIGLYNGEEQLAYDTWHAHRTLAETLHSRVIALMQSEQLELKSIQGIVCYEGPGSFTGLRIGLTVANTLAYSFGVPVVAEIDHDGESWQLVGIHRLLAGESDSVALPKYGAPAIVTTPKK